MGWYLNKIESKEDLLKLFVDEWNWEFIDRQYNFTQEDKEDILKYVKNGYIDLVRANNIDIFLIELQNPNQDQHFENKVKHLIRPIIISKEFKDRVSDSIFIFYYNDFDYIYFVKGRLIGKKIEIRRYVISPENREKLRTPSEQLMKLRIAPQLLNKPSYLLNLIEDAFDVDTISEQFFNDYIKVFKDIKDSLNKQEVTIVPVEKKEKLIDFIHLVLNRLMFLYFVQKRGCFGGDKKFLIHFWNAYKEDKGKTSSFHKDWLNVLFFDVLAKPADEYKDREYLKEFNAIFKKAPYLNGGLFQEDPKLDGSGWLIPDELFDEIFEFFESYNFTVEESTPFDIEIAIDPEMLGNIYEHLVNVEEIKEQKKAGIFYTPKVEIDFMIRRSLVEFLYNKTNISKEKLYQFVFPEENNEIINPFTREEGQIILEELENITILDPACGSGHYLVVAVNILYQLKEILWKSLGIPFDSRYEGKKKIIEKNIYGNDIKEWAVSVAKLRLWLDLFVDIPEADLNQQFEPLLPNLKFKIRWGDSLVQRIGNQIIPLRKLINSLDLDNDEKILLKNIKENKVKAYKNEIDSNKVTAQEKDLLLSVIEKQKRILKQEIQKLNATQPLLFLEDSSINKVGSNLGQARKTKEKELEFLNKFEDYIRTQLVKNKELPMIWELAFAEVFEMKNGFDIVIANPPYVRQQKIADLTGFYSKSTYKQKLIEQIKQDWSSLKFGNKNPVPEKSLKRCDLYVYFYLKGLKLLNENGILCYISSNSWLDVDYGKILQEFLLKRVPIIAIYDNLAKRSFKHADVNTIIAITKAPKENDFETEVVENNVRFVNFKKPFEEIMYSEIFIDIENNKNLKQLPEGKRRENEIYRLHIVNQKDLYEYGKDKNGSYSGNKWGGKYLRSPEIYWKILEKGKGKWVRLGDRDIAEVRMGIITGANEFFYLKPVGMTVKEVVEISEKNPDTLIPVKNGAGWEGKIEARFLKPVIKSPRELKTIMVRLEDLNYLVFMCHEPKSKLSGTKSLEYIKWGEKQGYQNRPTCRQRERWWDLGNQEISLCGYPMVNYDRLIVSHNAKFYNDANIVGIYTQNEYKSHLFTITLNSSFNMIYWELFGISNLGEGAIKQNPIYFKQFMIFNPLILADLTSKLLEDIFSKMSTRIIGSIFTELGFDPSKPIREQEPNPLPDRKALDDIIFDALGLTEEERKEVYWAVAELVQNRLQKAKSV